MVDISEKAQEEKKEKTEEEKEAEEEKVAEEENKSEGKKEQAGKEKEEAKEDVFFIMKDLSFYSYIGELFKLFFLSNLN